jgi:hypothetical protein
MKGIDEMFVFRERMFRPFETTDEGEAFPYRLRCSLQHDIEVFSSDAALTNMIELILFETFTSFPTYLSYERTYSVQKQNLSLCSQVDSRVN